MDSDELIAFALEQGIYDVNLSSGAVTNRRGRVLSASVDKDGYQTITLYVRKGLQRTVRVHRMVAIKAWGLVVVRGRQVAHRDGNRVHNTLENLWLPESVKEHNRHDGTDRNLVHGQRKCKEMWAPCVRCGAPDGQPYHARKTPARVTGTRFGFEGDLCWRCYHMLDERERRALRRAS